MTLCCSKGIGAGRPARTACARQCDRTIDDEAGGEHVPAGTNGDVQIEGAVEHHA